MERIVYLDNNATTPSDPEVVREMSKYFSEEFGNASSQYTLGMNAREAVEGARARIASILNCMPKEIFFTGCGTESDNIAIAGTARRYKNKGSHIITSSIEHHAVLETVKKLGKEGFEWSLANVTRDGIVDIDHLRSLLREDTLLVSVMYANNETGAIQPIKEIASICREKGIYFHTDAVQAAGKLPLDVKELGVDMLSLSGHKFHAPKGIGILYKRNGVNVVPLTYGGHHEMGVRPGTENVPYIMGTAKALEIADGGLKEHCAEMFRLKTKLKERIMSEISGASLNTPENSVCNTLNVSFSGLEGESMLLSLDEYGIEVSTGSACSSGSLEPSHVILAMGRDHLTAHGSIRFSLSKYTTSEEIDYTVDRLKEVIERIRRISPYK